MWLHKSFPFVYSDFDRAETSALPLDSIWNSSIQFWLDEANNEIEAQVKKSDWTSFSATLSWVWGWGWSWDVVWPISSTDNAIARFDATTWKIIQNSWATISDTWDITANNLSWANTWDQDLSGLMVKSNNLSDLTNTTTARTNLGVDIAWTDNSTNVTVTDTAEIDFTLTGQNITASIKASSIDETKLDVSTNTSLDLADTSTQPSDNISTLTNDSGFISDITGETINNLSNVLTSMIPTDWQVLTFDTTNGWQSETIPAWVTDHTLLTNIWTNTHTSIDTHIATTGIHFTQASISIPASQISDFDTEVSNNTSVTTNTAKVTNATHTWDVTWDTALTLANTTVTAWSYTVASITVDSKGRLTSASSWIAWHTVQDEWISLTNRTNLNFIWPSVVVTDNVWTNSTDVTINTAWLSTSYTLSNISVDRILDWNSTTIDEIADVLGTVINDMKVFSWTIWTSTVNNQTWTTYTLAIWDVNNILEMDNASANTITIPTDANLDFVVWSVFSIIQDWAWITTITWDTGVSLNGVSAWSISTTIQFDWLALYKKGANDWTVINWTA